MNKLLLVEDKKINEGIYEIEYQQDRTIEIENQVDLYNYDVNNSNLTIHLKKNSTLDFHKINKINQDTNLNIILDSNSTCHLNWLIINEKNSKVSLNVSMLGDNNKCYLKVRILNKENQNIDFICNGIVKEKTINQELLEDLKGLITSSDSIHISPNMIIDTNEVMANHLVTIGTFNEQELFYLMTKGLSISASKKMLTNSFMSQVLDDNNKEMIQTEVINIE